MSSVEEHNIQIVFGQRIGDECTGDAAAEDDDIAGDVFLQFWNHVTEAAVDDPEWFATVKVESVVLFLSHHRKVCPDWLMA